MNKMVRDFYEHMKKLDGLAYLENYLKYQLAPVIHGLKPSLTVTITYHKQLVMHWDENKHILLEKLGLEEILLRHTDAGIMVLIYNKQLLQKVLNDDKTQLFLTNLHYSSCEVTKALAYLKYRYNKYHCPHELGIFLGIPLDDVKDFMNCSTKKCMLRRYWKVYNNIENAKKIFDAYDYAKEQMLYHLTEELQLV